MLLSDFTEPFRRFLAILGRRLGKKSREGRFQWLVEEWQQLGDIHEGLSDESFLRSFEPFVRKFEERRPYLERRAAVIERLFPPNLDSGAKRSVLEIASGCDVLPSILRARGYDAVGLDAAPMVVRYCKLKNIEIVAPKQWDSSPWTHRKFDVVTLIAYAAGPDGKTEWSRRALKHLSENVLFHLRNGSIFLLFDLRQFETMRAELAKHNLPIRHRALRKKRLRFFQLWMDH